MQLLENNELKTKLHTLLVSKKYYWYHATLLILAELFLNFVIIKKIKCKKKFI